MAKISYEERRKNSKLTQFSEFREIVIANTVRPMSQSCKRDSSTNKSLFDF